MCRALSVLLSTLHGGCPKNRFRAVSSSTSERHPAAKVAQALPADKVKLVKTLQEKCYLPGAWGVPIDFVWALAAFKPGSPWCEGIRHVMFPFFVDLRA